LPPTSDLQWIFVYSTPSGWPLGFVAPVACELRPATWNFWFEMGEATSIRQKYGQFFSSWFCRISFSLAK
jgi:hypothetical protein